MSVTFPPPQHFFRDLRYTMVVEGEREIGSLPIQPAMRRADGALPVGALVTLVDMVAGRTGMRAAPPQYPITSDIDLRVLATGDFERLSVTADLLRCGSRSVVLSSDVYGEGGEQRVRVAFALANFALFPPVDEYPMGDIAKKEDSIHFPDDTSALRAPLAEQLGLRTVDAATGVLEVAVVPYVMNPLAVLQGGVHAVLAEAAGETFVRSQRGGTPRVSGLSIRYLASGRTGPVRTTTRPLRTTDATTLLDIELRDLGQDNRVITAALIEVAH